MFDISFNNSSSRNFMFIHLMSNEGKIISFLYLTLPHVFSLFFPVNEGWSCLVNMSTFGFFFSVCVG